jgi:hypothetical protein
LIEEDAFIVNHLLYKTITDSPSRNVINNKKGMNEQGYVFNLAESEKIDAVY